MSNTDNRTTFHVHGMTCTSCAAKVSGAVESLDGVTETGVDLTSGTLTVTGPVLSDAVRDAVTAAGYQVS